MRRLSKKRIKECVEWSNCSAGVLENNTPAWFIVDQVYVGLYNKDLDIFCMADNRGFRCCDVAGCAPVGAAREIASYPKHGERVAVEIPQLPCIVTGIFNAKYLEVGEIEPVAAIELDPIYDFGYVSGAIAWSKVFSWYKVPEIPNYLLYDKSNIVEMPYSNEGWCKEDVGCPEECLVEEDIEIVPVAEADTPADSANQEDDINVTSEIAKSSVKKESKIRRGYKKVKKLKEGLSSDSSLKNISYEEIDLDEWLVVRYIPRKDDDLYIGDEEEDFDEELEADSDYYFISIIIKTDRVSGKRKYTFEARGDFHGVRASSFEELCDAIVEKASLHKAYFYGDVVLDEYSVQAVKRNIKKVALSKNLKKLLNNLQ